MAEIEIDEDYPGFDGFPVVVDRGETAEFPVDNTGFDSTLCIRPRGSSGAGWFWADESQIANTEFTERVELDTSHLGIEPGTYDVQFVAYDYDTDFVTCRDDLDPLAESDWYDGALVVEVVPGEALVNYARAEPIDVEVGETFDLRAGLENPGGESLTTDVDVRVESRDTGDEWVENTQTVSLEPRETMEIVWTLDLSVGSYGLTVDTGDDSAAAGVNVWATFDESLVEASIQVDTNDVEVGDEVTATVTISNDNEDWAEAEWQLTVGGSAVESGTVGVNGGETATIDVVFTVDSGDSFDVCAEVTDVVGAPDV